MKDLDLLMSIYKSTFLRYEKLFILYKIDNSILYYNKKNIEIINNEYYTNFLDAEISYLAQDKKKYLKFNFKKTYFIYDIEYINISLPDNISEKLDNWAILKINSKGKTLGMIALDNSNVKYINYLFPRAILWRNIKPLEKNIYELTELLYKEKSGYKNFDQLLEISRKINI